MGAIPQWSGRLARTRRTFAGGHGNHFPINLRVFAALRETLFRWRIRFKNEINVYRFA